MGRRLWAAGGAHEAVASVAGHTHHSEKNSLAAGRRGTGLQHSPSSKPHPRTAIPQASVRGRKNSESHSSICTQTPGASHEMMLRQQNRLGTGRSNSASQHPSPHWRGCWQGTSIKHLSSQSSESSLGLLTLLTEVAQNNEALNIS